MSRRAEFCINHTNYNLFLSFCSASSIKIKDEIKLAVQNQESNHSMDEVRYNTERIYDYNKNAYDAVMSYNYGVCAFNEAITHNRKLSSEEKKQHNNISIAHSLVKPLSYPINLFHSFDSTLLYPNFKPGNMYSFNYCLSKSPSCYFVKSSYFYGLLHQYMYIRYPVGTRHLCSDVRTKESDSYDYLAINEILKNIGKVFHITFFPFSIKVYYVFDFVDYLKTRTSDA